MQICNECIRGLTIGRNEVCLKCKGTGFEQPVVVEAPKETVVQKAVKAVKKAVKKKK